MFALKSSIFVVQNIVSGIMGFVALFFILRDAGLQPWGIMAFGLAFLGIWAQILDFGFGSANIKRISEGNDFETCLGTYFIIKLILIAIFVSVVFGVLYTWTAVLHRGFQSSFQEDIIFLLLPYFILSSLVGFYNSALTARLEAAKAVIPPFLESVIRNALYIAASALIAVNMIDKNQFSYVLALILILSEAAYLIIYVPLTKGWKMKRPTKKYILSYTRFAIPIGLGGVVGAVYGNISSVFIQLFWNSTEVGAFYSIQKIVLFVSTIATPFVYFLFPTLSALYFNNKKEEYFNMIVQVEKYLSLIFLPIIMVIIVLSAPILNLWSSALVPYYMIAVLLGISAYLTILNSSYTTHFNASDNPKKLMIITSITGGIGIALNFLLIPKSVFGVPLGDLGAEGAAVSFLITTILGFGIIRFIFYKSSKILINKNVYKQLLSAVPAGLVLFLINYQFHFTKIYFVVGEALLGLGLYYLILYLFKGITKEDWNLLKNTASFKKMLAYFKEELKNK